MQLIAYDFHRIAFTRLLALRRVHNNQRDGNGNGHDWKSFATATRRARTILGGLGAPKSVNARRRQVINCEQIESMCALAPMLTSLILTL